ncbi:MAG: heme o synthase [Planctomycetota bacterium]
MSPTLDTTRRLPDPSVNADDASHVPSPYDPVEAPAGEAIEKYIRTPSRLSDLKALTKPRITRMVVITAGIGFVFGVDARSVMPWGIFAIAMLGTALSCMAASVFNQVYERDTDALMHRTRNRPLAADRVSVKTAMWLGIALTLAGLGVLLATGLFLAAAFCAFTIASYALIYTPMKRVSTLALIIGAVPGAMPPVIGFAASTGSVGPAAALLFAIMFVWQVPHFLAIAWLYREDYARADLAMLPVIDPSGVRTFRQTLIGCLLLLPVGLLPSSMGIAGRAYFAVAAVCGLGFLAFAVALVLRPTRGHARRLFFASLVYLPVVLIAMMVDRM